MYHILTESRTKTTPSSQHTREKSMRQNPALIHCKNSQKLGRDLPLLLFKRQHLENGKTSHRQGQIFANHILIKHLHLEYLKIKKKKLKICSTQKTDNPIKWAKNLKRHFTKDTQMANAHIK